MRCRGQGSRLKKGAMATFSIRARLLFLAGSLLAIIALSSAFLTGELERDTEGLAAEARLVSTVRDANNASHHFGNLKYWVTDAAMTGLARSQQKAEMAKAELDSDLKAIARVDPKGVVAIESEVARLTELGEKAANAYAGDDSAAADRLMAEARSRIGNVDKEIAAIVDRLEGQALQRRDAAMSNARQAVTFAVAGGIAALALALSLTALIVRSINAPLRRLRGSMVAIAEGDLDAPVPAQGPDEIGAMANALGALRKSLIERNRLERERRRAEEETRRARDKAETALSDLKAAQRSLVHAEKMASLGQLTAGIAHEIKNPLNFVNNFADLSVELLDELKAAAAPAFGSLDTERRAEVDEIVQTLSANLAKIAEHGRRADGIVKSMLLHSRGGSGERQAIDLNGLVEEALSLAYHGARAQDQSFNITLERAFDRSLAPIEVVPQDITRVFLNLFANGFYAAASKSREANGDFRPSLKVATREEGDAVEIRIRDNGTGIPPENRDKLFQPFFTTKPTGEGTGLGLSISYDIVTDKHGGTISVESEPGAFTEFCIRLPRKNSPASGKAA